MPLTVAHLIDSFDDDAVTRVKTRQASPATLAFYRAQLKKLRAAAGTVEAGELRPRHLHAVDFTNHFVRVLKQLYRWAADADLVDRDPFRKLATPSTGQRQRVLSEREVWALYRSATPRFRVYLFFAVHTIMRPQELRQLVWGQVDLTRRCVTLQKFKGKDRRKDGVRVRVIPLDMAATRRLARMHAKLNPRPTDPVIVTQRGNPWDYTSQRRAMREARDRAGLVADAHGERVVCYSIRHTGATEAVRDGVEATVLADIMGHASLSMTRRYLHRTAEDLVRAVDRRKRSD